MKGMKERNKRNRAGRKILMKEMEGRKKELGNKVQEGGKKMKCMEESMKKRAGWKETEGRAET